MSGGFGTEPAVLRVGRMPYLNVAPFYFRLEPSSRYRMVIDSPANLGLMARRREIDTAPFSFCDTLELPHMEPLSDFVVACRGPVGSVMLFSRRPLERLGGAEIRVTPDTATSVRLLQVLLREADVRDYRLVRGLDGEADAVLLIGDRALSEAQQGRWPHVIDLCDEWMKRQGLPFVFARWMITRGHPAAADFAQRIERSLAAGLADIPAVLAAGSYAIGGDAAHRYLHNFIYRLDDSARRGMARFQELLRGYGIQ